ncbi:MAG TPA: hypothetical protein VH762_10445 [Gemmatimonadaceae bacterium]
MARPRLAVAALIMSLAACEPCGKTGMTISAFVKQTAITAPPGGPAQVLFRVNGSNFHSSVPMTISFRNYPALNAAQVDFSESGNTDGGGVLAWSKSIFLMPQRNFSADPLVDVWVTAKETNGGCFATTSVKTSQILNPPF